MLLWHLLCHYRPSLPRDAHFCHPGALKGKVLASVSDFSPFFSSVRNCVQWIKWQQTHLCRWAVAGAVVGTHVWAERSLNLLLQCSEQLLSCMPDRASPRPAASRVSDWEVATLKTYETEELLSLGWEENGHAINMKKMHLCRWCGRSAVHHNADYIVQGPPSLPCTTVCQSTCESSAGKQFIAAFLGLALPFSRRVLQIDNLKGIGGLFLS